MTMEFDEWPMIVQYKGLFDFDTLYKYVHEWLEGHRYTWQEDKYKIKPDSPWGFEHKVKIKGYRKVDAYFRYHIYVFMQGNDITEVEVNGKKMLNGRLKIIIEASVETDFSGRFEGSKFTKWLEKVYNYMIKREIELTHWDTYYYVLHDLQSDMKKILNMYADQNYFK